MFKRTLEKILDRTCLQTDAQMKLFEQKIVREIVHACVDDTLICYNVQVQKDIEFHRGYFQVNLRAVYTENDLTITKTRSKTFRDLGTLIVQKEAFVEFIRESFAKR